MLAEPNNTPSKREDQRDEPGSKRKAWVKPQLSRLSIVETASGDPFSIEDTPYVNAS